VTVASGAGLHKYAKRTYRMATAQRLDVQKGKDLITLEELEGRDIT